MLKTNPFLHLDAERIYDPLTDRALVPGDAVYERFRAFQATGADARVAGAAPVWA